MAAKLNITAADIENLNKLDNNVSEKKEWVDIPFGDYEVTLKSAKCKVCDPDARHDEEYYRVVLGFHILNGEYADENIYYVQNLDQVWMLKNANKFIASLKPNVDMIPNRYVTDGEFDVMKYNDMLEEIYDDVTARGLEYHLVLAPNSKGFKTYTIAEVFDE